MNRFGWLAVTCAIGAVGLIVVWAMVGTPVALEASQGPISVPRTHPAPPEGTDTALLMAGALSVVAGVVLLRKR